MSDLHELGISGPSRERIESVDPGFLREGLLRAREKSWQALREIRDALEIGLTEEDARRLALEHFRGKGVTKHWHKPYIRFGPGTALTFHDPLQPDYRLREGDPVSIDLGPVWPDPAPADPALTLEYEGDVGESFVFGGPGLNPEAQRCAELARALFEETRALWIQEDCSGAELYGFLRQRAAETGYVLIENVDGHRLSDFPHHKYARERLTEIAFPPSESLWVLELQINDPSHRFGAFYEDLLLFPSSNSPSGCYA